MAHLTFRQLLKRLTDLAKQVHDANAQETLDALVTVRVITDDDCYAGGVISATIEFGCAEDAGLIIDADQSSDTNKPS